MGGLAGFGALPNIPTRDQPPQSVRPSRRLQKEPVLRGSLRPIPCPAVPRHPLGSVPAKRECYP